MLFIFEKGESGFAICLTPITRGDSKTLEIHSLPPPSPQTVQAATCPSGSSAYPALGSSRTLVTIIPDCSGRAVFRLRVHCPIYYSRPCSCGWKHRMTGECELGLARQPLGSPYPVGRASKTLMACYMKAGFMQSWYGIMDLSSFLGIHEDGLPACQKASGAGALLSPSLDTRVLREIMEFTRRSGDGIGTT